MTNATLRGKPDAGNPHVRFDEGEVAPVKPRRGSLLYKRALSVIVCATLVGSLSAANVNYYWVATGGGNLNDPNNWDPQSVPGNNDNVYITGLEGDATLTNDLPVGRHFLKICNDTAHTVTIAGNQTLDISLAERCLWAKSGDMILDVPVNFVNAGNPTGMTTADSGRTLTFNKKITFSPPDGANWTLKCGVSNGIQIFNDDIEGQVTLASVEAPTLRFYGALNVNVANFGVYWTNCGLTLGSKAHACPRWEVGSMQTVAFTTVGTLSDEAVLAFDDAKWLSSTAGNDWDRGYYQFAGDETIDRIDNDHAPIRASGKYQNINRLQGTGTLTLRASQSFMSYAAWNDSLSMVYDPLDDYTFNFGVRTNAMSGSITVKGGTLALQDGVKFTQVPEVKVTGGTLGVDCPVWGSPFVSSVVLHLYPSATLALSSGSALTVARCRGGNVYVSKGTYTGVGYGKAGVTEVSWIEGEGTLTVTEEITCWKNAVSGDWNDATKWSDGVPTATKPAFVMAAGDDYTITVTKGTVMPTQLLVENMGDGRATLTGDFDFEQAWIEIGSGARIEVPTGKTFFYSGTDASGNRLVPESATCTDLTSPIRIHDGGELLVDGGTVTITNLTGFVKLSGTVAAPSKITVAAGSFGVFAKKGGTDRLVAEAGGQVTFEDGAVFTGGAPEYCVLSGDGGTITFKPGAICEPSLYSAPMPQGEVTMNLLTDVFSASPAYVVFGLFAQKTGRYTYNLSNTVIRVGSDELAVCAPRNGLGYTATDLETTVNAGPGTSLYVKGDRNGEYMAQGTLVGYAAQTAYSTTPHIVGTLNLNNGSVLTNGYGHFIVGAGFAKGIVNVKGGDVVSGVDGSNHVTKQFVVGAWHGEGEFALDSGSLTVATDAYVGGAVTNVFPESVGYRYWGWMGSKAFTYHDAKGVFTQRGGTAAFARRLIVGSDGTGEIAREGSVGSFVAQDIVFSNTVENAASGGVARFTLDANGVAPLKATSKLVIGANAKLIVDTSAYSDKGHSVTLFRYDELEGRFAEVELTGDFAQKAVLQYGPKSIKLASGRGLTIILR